VAVSRLDRELDPTYRPGPGWQWTCPRCNVVVKQPPFATARNLAVVVHHVAGCFGDAQVQAVYLEALAAGAFQLFVDYTLGRRGERLDRLFRDETRRRPSARRP
jgi:hypothetical protein